MTLIVSLAPLLRLDGNGMLKQQCVGIPLSITQFYCEAGLEYTATDRTPGELAILANRQAREALSNDGVIKDDSHVGVSDVSGAGMFSINLRIGSLSALPSSSSLL